MASNVLEVGLLAITVISTVESTIIAPNFDNGYLQIYNSSVPSEYESHQIFCNATICQIICDLENSCKSTIINASLSDTLLLQCINTTACKYLSVIQGPITSAHINCDAKNACRLAEFNLTDTLTVNTTISSVYGFPDMVTLRAESSENVFIHCQRDSSTFYVNNANTVEVYKNIDSWSEIYGPGITNQLTIHCVTDECHGGVRCPYDAPCNIICNSTETSSCRGITIYVPNHDYQYLTIPNCDNNDVNSCQSIRYYCEFPYGQSNLVYHYDNERWECDSSSCCPLIYNTYECAPNVDCIVDCSSQLCTNWKVDATNATSLSIYCLGDTYACRGIRIQCPINANISCSIVCASSYSCWSMIVKTEQNMIDTFDMECSADYSCKSAIIKVSATSMTLNCSADFGCYDAMFMFYLDVINVFYLDIGKYGIKDSTFLFEYNDTVFFDEYQIHFSDVSDVSDANQLTVTDPDVVIIHFEFRCDYCKDFYIDINVVESADIDCYQCDILIKLQLLDYTTDVDINYTGISGIHSGDAVMVYAMESLSNDSDHDVNIHCIDCESGVFNFSNVAKVSLECQNCQRLTLFAADTASFSLNCSFGTGTNDYFACQHLNMYCPYDTEDSCIIECPSTELIGTESCTNLTIHVDDSFASNYLTLSCGVWDNWDSTAYACKDISFHCTGSDGNVTDIVNYSQLNTNNQSYQYCTESTTICCPFDTQTTESPIIFSTEHGTTAETVSSKITIASTTALRFTDTSVTTKSKVSTVEPSTTTLGLTTASGSSLIPATTTDTMTITTFTDGTDDTLKTSLITHQSLAHTSTEVLIYAVESNDSVISTTIVSMIIPVCCIDLILVILCVYYIIVVLSPRLRLPGNASLLNTLKSFKAIHYINVILDLFDVITDYVFAASLIVDANDSNLRVLGWISLCFGIVGLCMVFFKYSAYRKLIALQKMKLKTELTGCADQKRIQEIMNGIRCREMDINIISLLNGCIEDIPQTLIVLLATAHNKWNYISVLTLSLSMFSFSFKLCKIVASKLGCDDESISDEQLKLSFISPQKSTANASVINNAMFV